MHTIEKRADMKNKKSKGINYKAARAIAVEDKKEPDTVLDKFNNISKKRMLQIGTIVLVSVLFFGAALKKS